MSDLVELWLCGHISQKYGISLKGVIHANKNGNTYCGLPARELYGRFTEWRKIGEDVPEKVTCNRCRGSLGLESIRNSVIDL